MSYFASTYSANIKPILLDWITNSGSGKNVTNLAKSLANRAQSNLWAKKPWSNLVERVEVTLTDGSYDLPNDFGRIVDLWADLTGHGTPSYYYFDGDNYEKGYRIDAGFTKAAGYNRTLTFHYAQQSNVYMRYQKIIDDFVDSGDEYSFFPANLILAEAQKINCLHKGDIKEYQGHKDAFQEIFDDFCNTTQWCNYDPGPYMRDRHGNQLYTESYSLSGEGIQSYSELPNSYIL
jgi:hypothetical protein